MTHWHPQAPAREYRVGSTGATLTRMKARVDIATRWFGHAVAGDMPLTKMMVVKIAQSRPFEATIAFSCSTTLLKCIDDTFPVLAWRSIAFGYIGSRGELVVGGGIVISGSVVWINSYAALQPASNSFI